MVDPYIGVYVIFYGKRDRRAVISRERRPESRDWYRIDISGMDPVYRRVSEMQAWLVLRNARKEEEGKR